MFVTWKYVREEGIGKLAPLPVWQGGCSLRKPLLRALSAFEQNCFLLISFATGHPGASESVSAPVGLSTHWGSR